MRNGSPAPILPQTDLAQPALRYAQFEPKVAGIRAMLPHVDELRPVHNMANLEAVCEALAKA